MSNRYIYGKLNQEAVRPSYGGSKTDSLIINVDNENMVISGDVIWDSALGELSHKAYPGDKGARNYKKIIELSSKLEKEISTATNSRKNVESKVGYIEKNLKELDLGLKNLINSEAQKSEQRDKLLLERCIEEVSRAIESENQLLNEIKNETANRKEIDSTLTKRLEDLSGSLSTRILDLQKMLKLEVDRSTDEDKKLSEKINSESERARIAELELHNAYNDLSRKVDESNSSVTESISNLYQLQSNDKKDLSNQIESEKTRALTAENSLQQIVDKTNRKVEYLDETTILFNSELNAVTSNLDQLTSRLDKTENTISSIESSVNSTDSELEDIRSNLGKEITRSINQDNYHNELLQDHSHDIHRNKVEIETLKNDVQNIQETDFNHSSSINDLKEKIEKETKFQDERYQNLIKRIELEIKRAIAADEQLEEDTSRNSSRITSLQRDLTSIIAHYVNEFRESDEIISDRIDYEDEKIDVISRDTEEKIRKISDESLQRDQFLQSQIDGIEVGSDPNSVKIIFNDGSEPEVYVQTGLLTSTIPVTTTSDPLNIVRRDSKGNIIVNENESELTDYSAVSKVYVENSVNRIKEEIEFASFDIINGGTSAI